MNKLYVRVDPKSALPQFYRCAMLFTLAWTLVTVDNATAERLHAEQMLEVTSEKPADYVDPESAAKQLEADKLAAAQAAADEAAAAQAEADRVAKEQADQAAQAEADRVAKEQAEADRIAKEQADQAAADQAASNAAETSAQASGDNVSSIDSAKAGKGKAK